MTIRKMSTMVLKKKRLARKRPIMVYRTLRLNISSQITEIGMSQFNGFAKIISKKTVETKGGEINVRDH